MRSLLNGFCTSSLMSRLLESLSLNAGLNRWGRYWRVSFTVRCLKLSSLRRANYLSTGKILRHRNRNLGRLSSEISFFCWCIWCQRSEITTNIIVLSFNFSRDFQVWVSKLGLSYAKRTLLRIFWIISTGHAHLTSRSSVISKFKILTWTSLQRLVCQHKRLLRRRVSSLTRGEFKLDKGSRQRRPTIAS